MKQQEPRNPADKSILKSDSADCQVASQSASGIELLLLFHVRYVSLDHVLLLCVLLVLCWAVLYSSSCTACAVLYCLTCTA
jgi:hypothetical protein